MKNGFIHIKIIRHYFFICLKINIYENNLRSPPIISTCFGKKSYFNLSMKIVLNKFWQSKLCDL